MRAPLPWWGWSAWSALFASVALSLLVTARHEPVEADDFAHYGFPFPWTRATGASLEWYVAPHTLALDVAIVAVALLPFALALGYVTRAGAVPRVTSVVLGVLASLAVLATLVVPAAFGLARVSLSTYPRAQHRTLAVYPFKPF